ncbi:hypothetical protein TRVL_05369 [Trypanosoma vivax]|nr:hypothetical protein TRVL_05369 [Trypanosoma vivax]
MRTDRQGRGVTDECGKWTVNEGGGVGRVRVRELRPSQGGRVTKNDAASEAARGRICRAKRLCPQHATRGSCAGMDVKCTPRRAPSATELRKRRASVSVQALCI